MNDIKASGKLPERISAENYTANLIEICAAKKIIDKSRLDIIQNTLAKHFYETAEQFTKRSSGSVSEKRARLLTESVLYRSDAYLLGLRSHERAVHALCMEDMEDILQKGEETVRKLFYESADIFKAVYKSRADIDLFEYRYVTEKAYDEFRRNYSPRFNAAECPCNIDYPLLGKNAYDSELKGVMFICSYYRDLYLENRLCGLLSHDTLSELIESFGRDRGGSYKALSFNISEVIMNNLLGNALLGRNDFRVSLSEKDIADIGNEYREMSLQTVSAAASKGLAEYYGVISSPPLYMYMRKYIPEFAVRLCGAVSSNGERGVFSVC